MQQHQSNFPLRIFHATRSGIVFVNLEVNICNVKKHGGSFFQLLLLTHSSTSANSLPKNLKLLISITFPFTEIWTFYKLLETKQSCFVKSSNILYISVIKEKAKSTKAVGNKINKLYQTTDINDHSLHIIKYTIVYLCLNQ